MRTDRIAAAAIIGRDRNTYIASSHSECIALAVEQSLDNAQHYLQGFITDDGRFVGRVEAAMIARDAGQILKEKHVLYIEDLIQ